jgi:hypothetical protein
MKTSLNGAPIQTGRGLEETKRRIMEAFERARQHAEPPRQQVVPQTPLAYTEQQRTCFHERANSLSLAAMSSPNLNKAPRGPVYEVVVPLESVEQLISDALKGYE